MHDNLSLECLCNHEKVNLPAIQLLINKGADVNKGKPLECLHKQKDVNIEAMELLIDKGAEN